MQGPLKGALLERGIVSPEAKPRDAAPRKAGDRPPANKLDDRISHLVMRIRPNNGRLSVAAERLRRTFRRGRAWRATRKGGPDMRRSTAAVSAVILVFLVFPGPAPAQVASYDPWPMFHRNERHTGVGGQSGPLLPRLSWSYTTEGGIGLSSAAVDSLGYVCIGSGDDRQLPTPAPGRRVYRFDSAGVLVWSYETGGLVESSPALDVHGRLFVGSYDGRLYSLGTAEGAFGWSYQTADKVASSPVMDSAGRVFIGSYDNNLYCFDSKGGFAWSYETHNNIESSPALDGDGRVYVGSDDNNLYCLNSDGSLAWSYTTDYFVWVAPALDSAGRVYFGPYSVNRIYSLESSGALAWSYDFPAGYTVSRSSPALGEDGRVYIGLNGLPSKGYMYCLESNGSFGWSYLTADWIESSPAIDGDGRVFVGSKNSDLYCFDSAGVLAWSYGTGGQVRSSPALGGGRMLYVGSDDHTIYAFVLGPTPTPTPTPTTGPTATPTPTETPTTVPTPTSTPLPNYVELGASPGSVRTGGTEDMSWACDFSRWNYKDAPVNIYLAAIKGATVIDGPSSVEDALSGKEVFLAADGMTSWYRYTGSVGAPTWSGVAFPPAPLAGSKPLAIPDDPSLAGDWVFATAFVYADGSGYVRTDGKPVENSNKFVIRR